MNDDLTIIENAGKIEPDFTAQELSFIGLVAKGYSGVRAYRQAYPAKSHLKNSSVRANVTQLLANTDITTEVQTAIRTQARLARMAENRIDQILTEGSINSKTNKVAEVSMFMYEQANGKATQKIEQRSAHVLVTYDLTGSSEQIPDEILKQLADNK